MIAMELRNDADTGVKKKKEQRNEKVNGMKAKERFERFKDLTD